MAVTRGLMVAAGLLAASCAAGWGPVTHAYLARQAMAEAGASALAGAMCPDMNGFLLGERKLASNLKRLTHTAAGGLPASAFRGGMLTHNSEWGGDRYAHAYHYHPEENGYPHSIFKLFSEETGVSINEAEDVIEMVMDYVIARDMGAGFVRELAAAADAAGAQEEDMLAQAFAAPLAAAVQMENPAEAAKAIRSCFRSHQAFLGQLARGFLMPDEAQRILLRLFMPPHAGDADKTLQRAIELCADWRTQLDRIAGEIRSALISR